MPERAPRRARRVRPVVQTLTVPHTQNQWFFIRRQLQRDKAALAGGALLLVIIALTSLAALVAPYDPLEQSTDSADLLTPPSAQHWMGTDDLRRDVLSRVLHGGRTTISVGVISISAAVSVGLGAGLGVRIFRRLCR